jgi:hypothetical protein
MACLEGTLRAVKTWEHRTDGMTAYRAKYSSYEHARQSASEATERQSIF